MSATAFDDLAPTYDATFSDRTLGRTYRRAVWRWLDRVYRPGVRVLELGCGTGEDAVHLARRGVHVHATDQSPAMVELTRGKSRDLVLEGRIQVERLDLPDLTRLATQPCFAGAFSNFGALNCLPDLEPVADGLAGLVEPGGRVILGVMGRLVPWEWVWYAARGDWRRARRRLGPGGATWRGVTVRYPSIGEVRRVFAGAFRLRRVGALGALLPPTFAAAWADRHPRLIAVLDRWERALESVPPLPRMADHYLIEFERR